MLNNLKAFSAVAERGSFKEAANALNLSQPALTLRIKTLEDHLGYEVLARDRYGVRLTERGKRLLPFAHTALKAVEDGMSAASAANVFAASVRMICAYGFIQDFVPQWAAAMRDMMPDISLWLDSGFPAEARRLLNARLVDIALMYEEISLPGIHCEELFEDDLILVTSPESLAHWQDRIVRVDWNEQVNAQQAAWIEDQGLAPPAFAHSGDIARVLSLRGEMSGFVLGRIAQRHIKNGQLVRVPGTPAFLTKAFISYRRGAQETPHLGAALNLIHRNVS